jgi:hypothetical protein
MSIHRLKPSEIAGKIEEPGKHADGGGLYLQVAQPGQASWVYRFTVTGKERWKSLGPASLYKLEEVREKAHERRTGVAGRLDRKPLTIASRSTRYPTSSSSRLTGSMSTPKTGL